ncbi:LIN9-like protein, partial [Mya arenaria]
AKFPHWESLFPFTFSWETALLFEIKNLTTGIIERFSSPSKRGHPPRVRKRNSKFFNDDEDNTFSPTKSSRKSLKAPLVTRSVYDKKTAQVMGVRLRNLLKLPKAHKWVFYETLFKGENDFRVCLRESFPQLKVEKMRRIEWNKVRRLMGKPRRCSSAFFDEERGALQQKRLKIRLLQQRKLGDVKTHEELPEEIPMHLVIGTKVTARLRKPQDGLFTGTVDALDTVHNTYRITFDRHGLGTHSVPDYEVRSCEPVDTIPLMAFEEKQRPRPAPIKAAENLMSPPRFIPNSLSGGYSLTRLTKILQIKKDGVSKLKEMNAEAEKKKSYQQPLTADFQKRYANIVLELESLNKDLGDCLIGVQQYCQEIAPDLGLKPIDQPSMVKEKCDTDAKKLVTKISSNMFQSKKMSANKPLMELTFSENELNSFEFKSLQDTLNDVRNELDGNNLNSFKNNVEIHINHIQSGLSQMGNLHAFSNPNFIT